MTPALADKNERVLNEERERNNQNVEKHVCVLTTTHATVSLVGAQSVGSRKVSAK